MFSVPGWSITAPLKTQTGPAQVPSLPTSAGADNGASKKRKRKDDADDGKVKKARDEKAGKSAEPKKKVAKKDRAKAEPAEGANRKEKKNKDKAYGTGSNALSIDADNAKISRKDKQKEEKGLQETEAPKSKETSTADSRSDKKGKTKTEKRVRDEEPLESPARAKEIATPATDHSKTKKKKKASEDALDSTTAVKSKESKHSKETATPSTQDVAKPAPKVKSKLTPLQAQMAAKLASARFRHLNEKLYTTASADALDLFKNNPDTFEEYHSGFRQQVDVWPSNPVDGYIADIKRRGAVKTASKGEPKAGSRPLPRTQGLCTIADLGCGDAKLASDMAKSKENLNVKILSYDLYSPSPLVTRADIADLPLEDGSINVVVFCLALMGTNWPDFIDEAYRILHWKGELWVAEIKSRFGRVDNKQDSNGKGRVVEHSVGNRKKKPRSRMSEAEKKREDAAKQDEDDALAVEVDGVPTGASAAEGDETDVGAFVKVLASRGFVLDGDERQAIERGNKMFVKMRFLKAAQPTKGKNAKKGAEGATWKPKGKKFLDGKEEDIDEEKVLKPCVYKLR